MSIESPNEELPDREVFRRIAAEQQLRREREEQLAAEREGKGRQRRWSRPRLNDLPPEPEPKKPPERAAITLHCSVADFDEIKRRAQDRGLTMRKYLLAACLDKLPESQSVNHLLSIEKRLEIVEKRLDANSW